MAEQKTFLSASDVAELTEKGFLVFSGKISTQYFYKRFYDSKEVVSK